MKNLIINKLFIKVFKYE